MSNPSGTERLKLKYYKLLSILLSNSTCATTARRHLWEAGLDYRHGRAVQVDPIKPSEKAPGTKRLRLKCDELVSSFAFKFDLRRYTMAPGTAWAPRSTCTR